ncbi:MAG: radical SAM protein [Bryobacteraceae bacterium]
MSSEQFATAPPSLMQSLGAKAMRLGIPLAAQIDITYRCNERCIHCYLDHEDHGEMTTAEILDVLDQLASAGVFFLTISGGEIFMRRDFFEILDRARALRFCVKLKTNGVMIHEEDAKRLAEAAIDSVQISIYSHRPEVHDRITKLPGSLKKSVEAARLLRKHGIKVFFANVLMKGNSGDYRGVQQLAADNDVNFSIDPTLTPMMDGNRDVLDLSITPEELHAVFRDPTLVPEEENMCAPPAGPLGEEDAHVTLPCSAGHTACYVSPYGDVYPCVSFPLPSGNLRKQKFIDIWKHSPQLEEVRSITVSQLQGCSTCVHGSSCTRCPGLAYMEGNMRGPSTIDCEKSFARTGVPSVNLERKKSGAVSGLVQIQTIVGIAPASSSAIA